MLNPLIILKSKLKHPLYLTVWNHRRAYAFGLLALVGVDVINVVLPLFIRSGLDAIPERGVNTVLLSAVAIFALMVVQSVGRFLWRLYLMGEANRISSELRRRLYAHLQRLPLEYYHSMRTGDLMSRATSDVESVRMAVGPGVLVAADALFMFVLIVPVMFYLSWKLTCLAFAFYPLVPFITRRLGWRIENLFEKLQVRLSHLSSFAQESFGAIRLVKSLTLERVSAKRFRDLSHQYALIGEDLSKVEALFSPALGLVTNLGTFLILIVGGNEVISGALTLGTFVAFQRFVVQLSWPMEAIGWAVTLGSEGIAAFGRLDSVLSTKVPNGSLPPGTDLILETSHLDEGVARESASLKVRDLTFNYGGEFSLVLDNLTVAPGQKIGIVGPVGSGKTTFFNCCLRLYEPPSGAIFLDGVDIREIALAQLRRRIASVEQQVFLFSESIAANIGMGMEKKPAKHEQICHALEVAGVLSEVELLAGGTSSILGERGVNLSGGQKSRLALARALIRKPSLLILDDCFSSVDVEVENRITQALFKTSPELTMLVASHRLSIMPRLDEIWVLSEGRLVDLGSHADLLRRNAVYQNLWHRACLDIISPAHAERLHD